MTGIMDADAYIRVSRVAGRSGENFISPKVQKDRINGIAAVGGHRIIRWHQDLDESGAKDDRPGFQLMLERVEARETGGVIVAKLDRFSRSVRGAAIALKRIESAGGMFISAEDGFDTSTPMGRFALNMMFALAELEWERRRESWLVARSEAVSRGVHIASMTPAGYVKGTDGRLSPGPLAPLITEVFRAKAKGASWTELGEILESAGAITNRGAEHWTNKTISQILTNRVYLGEARSGEFINPDAHPPLIDAGTWKLAQIREQRTSAPHGKTPLAGLLRCAGCRYVMKADSMSPKHGEWAGTRVPIYRCRGKRSSGVCPAPASVMAHIIEHHVFTQFLGHIKDIGATPNLDREELQAAETAVTLAEAELEAYLLVDIGGNTGLELFQKGVRHRQNILTLAETELARVHETTDTNNVDGAAIIEMWDDLEPEERQEIMAGSIDAIMLRRPPNRGPFPISERVKILYRGEGPKGLPSVRNRPLTTEPYHW